VEDGVVASLLLIHDLYPVPLEERVQEALDSVRPYMESHGGDVELLGSRTGSRGCGSRARARVRGVGLDARAGGRGGAARDRAGPRGHRRRGGSSSRRRRRRSAFELPMAGGGRVSGWQALDVDVAPGASPRGGRC
jgi:hypothetical protein